jgi:hypothetical protein
MLGFDGVGQPGIIGAQFEIQCLLAHRKSPFNLRDPGVLARIEFKLIVKQGVKFGFDRRLVRYISSAHEHARHGGNKRHGGDQGETAAIVH